MTGRADAAELARHPPRFYDPPEPSSIGIPSRMLTFFRRGIMAKIALGVLFLTTVAMVITGFGTGGTGGLGELAGRLGADTVAQAGGEKITTDQVKETTNRQLDRMREERPELEKANLLRR